MDRKDTRPLEFGKKIASGKARFTPLPDEVIASWDGDIHRAYVTECLYPRWRRWPRNGKIEEERDEND